MTIIKLTDAQMTALETAGIFECPHGDDEIALCNAIGDGGKLATDDPDYIACIVCELSNQADELAGMTDDAERRAMYRKDSRVLTNLMIKIRATQATN